MKCHFGCCEGTLVWDEGCWVCLYCGETSKREASCPTCGLSSDSRALPGERIEVYDGKCEVCLAEDNLPF